MADRHTAAFWAGGAAFIAGGGIFMAVTGFEPTKTPGTVWANSWFDLGFAFVILGLIVTGIGVVLHFRREVKSAAAPAAINQTEWIATCDDSGEFPNEAMIFNLRHRFQNMGARQAFGLFRCMVTDPDGIAVEATGTRSYYQYVDPIFPGARPVRPGLYRFGWQGQKSNGEWVNITSGEHEVKGPKLIITILDDSQFENWQYVALIAALHVQVENTTDTSIRVGGYAHTSDPKEGLPWDINATVEEIMSVRREITRRDETQHYGQPLRNFARIPAHETISGWFLVAVNRPPAGGTPTITVIVKDDLANEYRVTLPARERQVHGS